jgi:hypothetical protein
VSRLEHLAVHSVQKKNAAEVTVRATNGLNPAPPSGVLQLRPDGAAAPVRGDAGPNYGCKFPGLGPNRVLHEQAANPRISGTVRTANIPPRVGTRPTTGAAPCV